MAEQQHEPLQQRHLDQHEAGAERAEVHEPAEPAARPRSPPRRPAAGRRRTATTSAAEMPISVSSALRPLPNSIDRPNATSNWSASFVVWKKNGRSSVVGRMSCG